MLSCSQSRMPAKACRESAAHVNLWAKRTAPRRASGWRACASACIRSADGSMSIPWWDARPSRQLYRSGTSKQTESTWIGESLSPPEVQPCGVHRQPRRDLASSPCSKLQNAEKEMASEETVRAEIGPILVATWPCRSQGYVLVPSSA